MYGREILVRRQYSGNAHGIIKGIGVVTRVYVYPELDQFWIIDYCIYDPDGNGKSKLDHVQEMLINCIYQKNLQFWAVLIDSWYAAKEIMLSIEKYKKTYYCLLKDNRQVDNSGGSQPLTASETKQLTGLEGYQCRKTRIVRNHIAYAILVWVHLKQVANETKQTMYCLKHELLSHYLRQQLKSPSIQMSFA